MTESEIQKIEAVADMMGDTPAGRIVRGAAKEIERLRALLGEIASGLSVRNPFDIANEAVNPSHMKGEG